MLCNVENMFIYTCEGASSIVAALHTAICWVKIGLLLLVVSLTTFTRNRIVNHPRPGFDTRSCRMEIDWLTIKFVFIKHFSPPSMLVEASTRMALDGFPADRPNDGNRALLRRGHGDALLHWCGGGAANSMFCNLQV